MEKVYYVYAIQCIVGTYPHGIPLHERDSGPNKEVISALQKRFSFVLQLMYMRLRYKDSAAEIYDALKAIPRTGWVIRGVPSPETVYDHTVALLQLADTLSNRLNLTEEEFDDLLHILEIHDWAEVTIGDIYIPNEDKIDYETKKVLKAEQERTAMVSLLADKPFKNDVLSRFDRYETGSDAVAVLAKEIDKLQSLMLAGEYETKYNIPLYEEFDAYYKRDDSFRHPVVLEEVSKLQEKFL